MPQRPPYAAPAVEAALSILETLGTVPSMGVTDLARKLNLSKSSVYRLLATLARRGYVEKNPQNDRYQLTYPLVAVGSHAASRLGYSMGQPEGGGETQSCRSSLFVSWKDGRWSRSGS